MNYELPDSRAGFRKDRGTRDQIDDICWIMEKAREFQKNTCSCLIDYAEAFGCVDHYKLENSSRDGNIRSPCCLLRNLYAGQEQQLELDMEQQSGSKSGNEYIKAVYCHHAYFTYMQSTSCKMQGFCIT